MPDPFEDEIYGVPLSDIDAILVSGEWFYPPFAIGKFGVMCTHAGKSIVVGAMSIDAVRERPNE